ncbi:DUF559 domain-containing protein [Nocardioides sp. CPCC 206347]|uniref:DUF559 domain-containing protein n=1 Tax=Nocardioides sp. CPCC 206347 TaxID=3406463 RepID=UPI003B43BA1A
MRPLEVMRECGGVADTAVLRARCGKKAIKRALDSGDIIRLRRGVYGLPGIAEAQLRSIELSATIIGPSAALIWEWKLKRPPGRPHVALLKGRTLTPRQRAQIVPHWWSSQGDVLVNAQGARIQTPLATAVHCLRTMPFDEALAVADSALRSGRVTRDDLLVAIAAAPRIGRGQAEAVARAADGRAANPFESCLRAICLDIRGLDVEPQVQIGPHRVDLADRRRRIVIEAESRTWHAGPDEHNADIRRYTTLVREGWLVIRFSYDDVMHDPAYVAEALLDVLRLAPVRAA